MSKVTITKKEYQDLRQRAEAYENLVSTQEKLARLAPSIRSRSKIISELKKTGRYNSLFLRSLARGLKKSPSFSA